MCFELSSRQDLYYQEQILMSRLLLKLFLLIFVYPYRRDFISVLEVAVSLNLENIDRTKADILSGDNMEEVRTFSAIAHEDDILQTYLKEIGKIKLKVMGRKRTRTTCKRTKMQYSKAQTNSG